MAPPTRSAAGDEPSEGELAAKSPARIAAGFGGGLAEKLIASGGLAG